jgi:hypothetical protein
MSIWWKLRTFSVPFVSGTIATGSAMAIAVLENHPVAVIPAIVATIASGLVCIVTSIGTGVNVARDGWPDPPTPKPKHCQRCKKLEEENKLLLEAIQ